MSEQSIAKVCPNCDPLLYDQPHPSDFIGRWKVYQDKIDKQVERFHYLQELKKYLEKMEGPSDLINHLVEYIDELKEHEGEALGNVINSSY